MTNRAYHLPVLLKESVDGMSIQPEGTYVDVTFGGGGHSAEILSRLGEKGRLFAFDQDQDAQENSIEDPRFTLIPANFRFIKRFLRLEGVNEVDGILGDFGVSSHQFDKGERGFSIRFEAELDMRMDQNTGLGASELVNTYSQEQLAQLIWQYGEIKMSRKLAKAIVERRIIEPIKSTKDLNDLLTPFFPPTKVNKFLAQVYQAIRIEVNQEMEALKEFLLQTSELITKGGRLSLISYHSLEDRLVKRFIRDGKFSGAPEKDFYGNMLVPFKKVGKMITPGAAELQKNKRSRSAKLRIGEKL
ncbi:peptidoglycan biosysnthesis associated S-adenosyl-dependent methyltransferase MraW [Psychroflexus torquis ATCC 700755]|uniref:Ribosomal RNA small subunit methyltransferase H n=1 Tax=Psychroflexus torquis (strain ATCC 700755 / CIP 106069 / ACAM 623) TaxID=313595 RepID=K4IL45_PSYTT|nr:16S rRNA (cytosine(1402)-N(4))-methyltransferase RsmH [Psychroflexus torquis]AFU69816.1 peptidoglycan biosysnthesis associated S-adenosyl-dependent methyltransferase MraW [Psychroflexus torquis ATCC 700755]